jgi:hypothetical protein
MSGTIGHSQQQQRNPERNPYSREDGSALSMGSLLESLGNYDTSGGSTASEDGVGVNEFLRGTGSMTMMSSWRGDYLSSRSQSQLNINHRNLGDAASQSSSRSASREVTEVDDASAPSYGGSAFPRPSRDKQHRGQGYRKLFQQVTRVGKGQKLSDRLEPEVSVSID